MGYTMEVGVYNPFRPPLDDVLAGLPPKLRPYKEHARLLIHFIQTNKWLGDVDKWGYSRLSSRILRQWVPARHLGPLWQYLTDAGAVKEAKHTAGQWCRGYRITEPFDGLPRRIALYHPHLIRKWLVWRDAYGPNTANDRQYGRVLARRRATLDHMRADLDRLTLAGTAKEITARAIRAGVDPAHATVTCSVIENGNHEGLTMDRTGWRVHSIVTRTATEIRRNLRLAGEPVAEVDVVNAQPLLFGALLREWPNKVYLDAHNIGNSAQHIGRGVPGDVKVNGKELDGFMRLCATGELYERIMDASGCENREVVKKGFCRDVLFGKPDAHGRTTVVFEREWPSLLRATGELKRRHGYKIISRLLQRFESVAMIDGVCGRLVNQYPDLHFITVHDALIVPAVHAETVRGVVVDELARHGAQATVKVKGT